MTQNFNKLETLNLNEDNMANLWNACRDFLATIVRDAVLDGCDYDVITVIYDTEENYLDYINNYNNEENQGAMIYDAQVVNYEVGMVGNRPAVRRAEDGAVLVDNSSDFELYPEEEEEQNETQNESPAARSVATLALATLAAFAAANPSGFTIDARTGEIPASGYCVALAQTQNSHGLDGLARVVELIQSGTTRATCVGGWLDTESGLYYYDATVLVQDRAAAEALGRANKQLAIFCLDTCEEIRL